MTNFGEWPHAQERGGGLRHLLFDPLLPSTAINIKNGIRTVLENDEPRAIIRDLEVNVNSEKNGFDVILYILVKNINEPMNVKIFLEKLR